MPPGGAARKAAAAAGTGGGRVRTFTRSWFLLKLQVMAAFPDTATNTIILERIAGVQTVADGLWDTLQRTYIQLLLHTATDRTLPPACSVTTLMVAAASDAVGLGVQGLEVTEHLEQELQDWQRSAVDAAEPILLEPQSALYRIAKNGVMNRLHLRLDLPGPTARPPGGAHFQLESLDPQLFATRVQPGRASAARVPNALGRGWLVRMFERDVLGRPLKHKDTPAALTALWALLCDITVARAKEWGVNVDNRCVPGYTAGSMLCMHAAVLSPNLLRRPSLEPLTPVCAG